MALIKCPECGTEVSDKASCCVKCGYPINKPILSAVIRFEKVAAFNYKCTTYCEGRQGESVDIPLSKPSKISINITGSLNTIEETIVPGKKYQVRLGGFLGTKYILTEY